MTICDGLNHYGAGEYVSFSISITELYTAHFAHKYGNSGEIICRLSGFDNYKFRLFGTLLTTNTVMYPPSNSYSYIGFIVCR